MIILLLFILGCIFGSFLCVLVDRLPRGEQVLKGRSHCEHCKHALSSIDLIPVVSYLLTKGKCRYCHTKIPVHTLFVELFCGLMFVSLYIYSINVLSIEQFILLLIIFFSLAGIFFSDLLSGIIPDEFNVSIVIATFIYLLMYAGEALIVHFIVGVLTLLFFLLLYFITKGRGMGFGDVKFAFVMGFFLGFPEVIVSLYFAFLTATFVSLILILRGKKKLKGGTIYFGPFLVLGVVFAYFFSDQVLGLIF